MKLCTFPGICVLDEKKTYHKPGNRTKCKKHQFTYQNLTIYRNISYLFVQLPTFDLIVLYLTLLCTDAYLILKSLGTLKYALEMRKTL